MKIFFEKFDKATYYKPSDFDKEKCDDSDKKKFIEYITLLSNQKEGPLLFRGTKIKNLKSKLAIKLNSNNSLYEGLFLVGDKAKNYLKKVEDIPHLIRVIDNAGKDVANWIFDEFSKLPIDMVKNDYFKIETNRTKFIKAVESDKNLIDYYLAGLHKWNSDILVNFVSTTSSLDVALSYDNDIVVLLWLAENYSNHVVGGSNLDEILKNISIKKLPELVDCFESEYEYSFKGFILPHFILGTFLVGENAFIINPALLMNENMNWIRDGFEINDKRFFEFIMTTGYKRFLTLHDNEFFHERNIC